MNLEFYWRFYDEAGKLYDAVRARLKAEPTPRWEISIGLKPGADIVVTTTESTKCPNKDHSHNPSANVYINKLNDRINLEVFADSLKRLSKRVLGDLDISSTPTPYSATTEATRRREEFFGYNNPIMSFDMTDHNGIMATWEEICRARAVEDAADACMTKTNIVPKEVLFMPNIIIPKIKNVIFSGPVTTVLWEDNTKTQARAMDGVTMEPEVGVALRIAKKIYKSQNQYRKAVKAWLAASDKKTKKNATTSDKKTKKTTSTAKKETKTKKTTSTEKKEVKAKKVTIKTNDK